MKEMDNNHSAAFTELKNSVHAALETYSNVHRGSGHFSMVTTHLYDKARSIVLDYLSLDKKRYVVIFCSPRREVILKGLLKEGSYKCISSDDIGLPLAVRALAVKKSALPAGDPFESGGGTTKLVSRNWIIWAHAPERFEAGTPAVINVIAYTSALLLTEKYGADIFRTINPEKIGAAEIIHHDDLESYTGHELLARLRETLIGKNVMVPTTGGQISYVNLDNAASTSTLEPVWNAFSRSLQISLQFRNEIVSEVRSVCSDVLGAPEVNYEIIFTSNTTEGINIIAEALAKEKYNDQEPVILNTLLEHNSNDLPWRAVPESSLIRLPVDEEGFINTGELESILDDYNSVKKYSGKSIKLVAVSGASNVLGSFNDLAEISRITHKYGAKMLVDAAQLVAHRQVDIKNLDIDYFVFCAHKVYAPFGTGVMVMKKGMLNFSPDEIQQIKASGEENTGGIAALGKALVLLKRVGLDKIMEEERLLTKEALNGLSRIPGLKIYGVMDPLSPRFEQKGGVIAFFLKGKMPSAVARELAEKGGIGIRYGCHCAHLLVKRLVKIPPFLEEFQRIMAHLFPGIVFPGLARVSMGIGTTRQDLERLFGVLNMISVSGAKKNTRAGSITGKNGSISRKDLRKLLDEFKNQAVRKVYHL